MWRLRGGRDGKTLALAAATIVVGAGLAVLVSAAGAPAAHAEAGAEPGMIVVADRGNDRLQAFYPDGTFAFKFGAGYGRQANSIDVGPDGRIIVAMNSAIHAFHPNGAYASGVVSGGEGIGVVGSSHVSAAVGLDGEIVVADGDRIQVFDRDGVFASVFDGNMPGGYTVFHDVDVAPDGRIVTVVGYPDGVQGPAVGAIRIFHPDGTPALSFGEGVIAGWGLGCVYDRDVDVAPDGRIVVALAMPSICGPSHVEVFRPLPNGTFASEFMIERDIDYDIWRSGGSSGLAVAPDGRIIVGASNHTVQVYRPNGSLALGFGGHASVQGGFDRPTDAAVAPDGSIVVAEPGSRTISVFHPNGTLAFAFGEHGHGDGAFYRPHHVAVAPDGRIVVGDTEKRRILVFEADGTPALAFGSKGHRAGQITDIIGMAVGPDGSVVVADRGGYAHNRVQVFSPDGAFVSEFWVNVYDYWWRHGSIAVGPDGRIVVAGGGGHSSNPAVWVLEPNGTVAFTIPLDAAATDGAAPAVAVAPDGRFVVVQGSRSQVFSPDGTFVFATEIDVGAVSVAVGPSSEIVVVDDRDDRVQVFNPNGTFAFSLLPDLTEGKFAGVGPIAVGPVTPPAGGDPRPLWTSIEPEEGGDGAPILRNFTGAGDVAYVTIDVVGLAGPGVTLDGSASSTVTFPASETVVAASFAEVTFPPSVTASHVPAGGQLALRIAADGPAAERVQAALGRDGSGTAESVVLVQGVVEVGGGDARVMFDRPIRIALEGQAGGRAFYVEGSDGTIVPIDKACTADDVDAVHLHLAGAGECQMDSAGGGDGAKIIYTYHLTKFGTVSDEGPAPGRTAPVRPAGGGGPSGGGGGGGPPPEEPVQPTVIPPHPPTLTINGYPIGGTLALQFGSLGSGPGEFKVPHAIAVGPDGIIAVADILNNRVQVFYPNGTYAFELALSGTSGYISYIAFGPDGRLFISDIKNHRVQAFDLQYP